jgi:hypothetical protein
MMEKESVSDILVYFNMCGHGCKPEKILLSVFAHGNKEAQFYKSVKKCVYYHELNLVLNSGYSNC